MGCNKNGITCYEIDSRKWSLIGILKVENENEMLIVLMDYRNKDQLNFVHIGINEELSRKRDCEEWNITVNATENHEILFTDVDHTINQYRFNEIVFKQKYHGEECLVFMGQTHDQCAIFFYSPSTKLLETRQFYIRINNYLHNEEKISLSVCNDIKSNYNLKLLVNGYIHYVSEEVNGFNLNVAEDLTYLMTQFLCGYFTINIQTCFGVCGYDSYLTFIP